MSGAIARQAVESLVLERVQRQEAERLNLSLRPMEAEAQRRLFLQEDARLRALWARRPWRE